MLKLHFSLGSGAIGENGGSSAFGPGGFNKPGQRGQAGEGVNPGFEGEGYFMRYLS